MNFSSPDELKRLIRQLPDYPVKDVIFLDITPLFRDRDAMRYAIRTQAEAFAGRGVDAVAGVEARGFIVGAPLAYELGVGFVPVRKPGKLPWRKRRVDYKLEYGEEAVEVHEDAFSGGQRVLLVDDLLATGGTAAAAASLIEGLGAKVAAISFVVELAHLEGRKKLAGYDVHSLVRYEKKGGRLV
ncbi:MAG: adenine phosphoribosyltransferase [Nitrososphaerota archaeon]|nr:adenine phosphoribosyltransferase [Nitrososphaerota archaeon]MDG6939307.1 adenine phosphoribosyltransferase [Nitrososphaerota archaeon]